MRDEIAVRLLAFRDEHGFVPSPNNWEKSGISALNEFQRTKLFQRCPVVTGTRYLDFFESVEPRLWWYMRRGEDYASIHDTKKAIQELAWHLGRMPTSTEFLRLRGTLETRSLKPRTLLGLLRRNCFYQAMADLGLTPKIPTQGYFLIDKAKKLNINFESEVSVFIDGKQYRVDFKFELEDGRICYLEVDGSSHQSVKAKDHNCKPDPAESFARKLARDAALDAHFLACGIPLVRMEYHAFLRLSVFEILERLYAGSSASFVRKSISREVLEDAFVRRGLKRRELANELGCTVNAIILQVRAWRERGVVFPKACRHPNYVSWQKRLRLKDQRDPSRMGLD